MCISRARTGRDQVTRCHASFWVQLSGTSPERKALHNPRLRCRDHLAHLSSLPPPSTMPPRRARAASTAAPPESRSRASKRAVSPDGDKEPAAKRVLRAGAANVEKPKANPAPNGKVPSKANGRAKAPAAEKPKSEKPKAPPRVRKVPQAINPLPHIPQHYRPPLQLFTWGSGAMSQLAIDYNQEIPKPRKNAFVAEHIEEGTFGGDEAGLESIAAGGLHTLFVDEKGTVSTSLLALEPWLTWLRSGRAGRTTMVPSGVSPS